MKNFVSSDYAKGARFATWLLGVLIAYSLAGAAFTSLSTVGSGSGLTSSSWNLMVADLNDLNTRVSAISGVPTGTVIAYNGTSCPSGWTEAAGAGVPAGPGGSATLNLRGQFVRGWNSTAGGLDAGRGFWSAQNATQFPSEIYGNYANKWLYVYVTNSDSTWGMINFSTISWGHAILDPATNSNGYPSDNNNRPLQTVRPFNVALLYCVKN